jgi:hypothetical protein
MYGKIFESIYDGSLYGDWEAIIVFKAMIVLADETGIIDMSPQAMAGRTSYPMDVIKKGLSVLQKPDPDSRHPGHDGRRIIALEDGRSFGWQIVNYKIYRNMATREEKKRADRDRIASKRVEPNEYEGVASCSEVSRKVANVAHTDTHTDTHTVKTKKVALRPVAVIHDVERLGINKALWVEFLANRKRLKAANTPAAINTLINKIEKLHLQGHDANTLVETANERGWKSVFEPDKPKAGNGPTARDFATMDF